MFGLKAAFLGKPCLPLDNRFFSTASQASCSQGVRHFEAYQLPSKLSLLVNVAALLPLGC